MSERQWPTLCEVFYQLLSALRNEGVAVECYGGDAEHPKGVSTHDISVPIDLFLNVMSSSYFEAELRLRVEEEHDMWVREAVLREISHDFTVKFTVMTMDFEKGLYRPASEMAWNLAGALYLFCEIWPKIKAAEDKYLGQLEKIREQAIDECFS